MKGNLISNCKTKVTACIMAAALVISSSDAFFVSAQDEVSDGNAAALEETAPGDNASLEGADEAEQNSGQTDADSTGALQENAGQMAPADETVPPQNDVEAPVDDGAPSEDDAKIPPEEKAGQGTADISSEKNEIQAGFSVTGTAQNSVTYDGQPHDISVQFSTTTINVEGNDIPVVPVTNREGAIYYVANLPGNSLIVTATDATNDSNKTCDVEIPAGVKVYGSNLREIVVPKYLAVTAENMITKRQVQLTSTNVAKPYDGTPLTNGGMPLETETGWVDGQGANYTFTKSITAVGTEINEFVISSYKEGTNPDNYDIHYTFGGLSVVDRSEDQKYILTIQGSSPTVKYSGKEQSVSEFILEGRSNSDFQVKGNGDPSQVLTVNIGNASFNVTGISAYGSGKNAGEYTVSVAGSPVITDREGNVVTGQFSFEFKPGKLTIEKRKVILTSASIKEKFDNKTHKKHKVTVSGDGFAEGEGATYEFTGKQKAVGESYNYFTYKLNEGTLEGNYDIEKVPGVLKIKKNDVAINETPSDNNNSSSDSGDSSTQEPAAAPANTAKKAEGTDSSDLAKNANPDVLGARRGQGDDVTVDIANPVNEDVLGARRSSTDDFSDLGRHLAVFIAAIVCMALLTLRRDKRIRK